MNEFEKIREILEGYADHPQNVYNDMIRHGVDYTGNVLSVHEAISAVKEWMEDLDSIALLQKVIDYHEGSGPYDFSGYDSDERAAVAFDAWHEIAEEIRHFLRKHRLEMSDKN